MQTKKIIVSAFILLISALSYGQTGVFNPAGNETPAQMEKPSFEVSLLPDVSPTVFKLAISNPEGKKLNLQISHQILGTLVDTTIYSVTFSSRYNLKEVEDGRYVITVSDRKEKIRKEVEVNTITRRSMELY